MDAILDILSMFMYYEICIRLLLLKYTLSLRNTNFRPLYTQTDCRSILGFEWKTFKTSESKSQMVSLSVVGFHFLVAILDAILKFAIQKFQENI